MNIDKDIEKVKEVINRLSEIQKKHSLNGFFLDEAKKEKEEIQAIENVLKELETYKKIAEWLTRYSIEKSINTFAEEKCEYTRKNKHCTNFSEENCIKCIIEWARKEVEK
jgi:deoxyhypusine synthase